MNLLFKHIWNNYRLNKINSIHQNWVTQLQKYEIEIKHVPGIYNVLPDYLSRDIDWDLISYDNSESIPFNEIKSNDNHSINYNNYKDVWRQSVYFNYKYDERNHRNNKYETNNKTNNKAQNVKNISKKTQNTIKQINNAK